MKSLLNFGFMDVIVSEEPDKIAVKDEQSIYSYKDLNQKTAAVFQHLWTRGITRGDRVGIFMENNADYIASVLAIMKSAAIFVPVSPDYPEDRLAYILNNCQPAILITNSKNKQKIENIAGQLGIGLLVVETINDEIVDPLPELPRYPKEIAYIIYTSGSTGMPKGVAIRWESLENYVQDTVELMGFDRSTVSLNMTPFYFDGSLSSIFCTLLGGGTIVIIQSSFMRDTKLIRLLKEEKITDLGCTPALFKMITESLKKDGTQQYSIQTIGMGGERCPSVYIEQLFAHLPNVRLFNRYGPTETTIVTSSYEITAEDLDHEGEFPIGKPIRNVQFYAFNHQGHSIQPGEVGELYIGGIQVMEGYWNDPELTRHVLIDDLIPGERIYRTGDLVTIDAKGNYIFVGRTDDMIKKQGFRIYISEVVHAFQKLAYVKEAFCLPIDNGDTSDIAAFVILASPEQDPTSLEIRMKSDLSQLLPWFMIPKMIRIVERFPATKVGKIDRQALRELI